MNRVRKCSCGRCRACWSNKRYYVRKATGESARTLQQSEDRWRRFTELRKKEWQEATLLLLETPVSPQINQ